MGHPDAHLSAFASATQIYPSNSPSGSAGSGSPPHSSHTTTHSDFQLNPISANDEHEANEASAARRIRILDVARLALTLLTIAAAAAVVGCEAHTLSVYNATQLDDGFFLPPLWPSDFDLRPSQGLLVGGAVAALTGLVYVGLGVGPVPTRLKLLVILVSISLSIIGLAGSIFGVAYSSSITSREGYDRDNIQSWTCRLVDGAADANQLFTNGLAGISAPAGFKRVCMETHFGFSLLAILICLETVVLVVTGLCAWMELKMRRGERNLAGSGFDEKDMLGRRFG